MEDYKRTRNYMKETSMPKSTKQKFRRKEEGDEKSEGEVVGWSRERFENR